MRDSCFATPKTAAPLQVFPQRVSPALPKRPSGIRSRGAAGDPEQGEGRTSNWFEETQIKTLRSAQDDNAEVLIRIPSALGRRELINRCDPYKSLAFKLICAPARTFDTGQPFFASSANFANAAASIPGTCASVSSSMRPMPKPSPVFSRCTVALV
jgi:hypothetical protein